MINADVAAGVRVVVRVGQNAHLIRRVLQRIHKEVIVAVALSRREDESLFPLRNVPAAVQIAQPQRHIGELVRAENGLVIRRFAAGKADDFVQCGAVHRLAHEPRVQFALPALLGAVDERGDDEMAVLFQVENGAVKGEKQPIKLLVGQNGAKFPAVAQDFEWKEEEFRLLLPCAVRKMAVNVPDVPLLPCLRFHQRRKVPFRLRRAVQQNEVRLPVVCFHDISSLIA